jgi:hypothetical protein
MFIHPATQVVLWGTGVGRRKRRDQGRGRSGATSVLKISSIGPTLEHSRGRLKGPLSCTGQFSLSALHFVRLRRVQGRLLHAMLGPPWAMAVIRADCPETLFVTHFFGFYGSFGPTFSLFVGTSHNPPIIPRNTYQHLINIYILLRRCALGQGSPVPLKLLYRKNPAREPGEKTCNYPLESRNKNPKHYKRHLINKSTPSVRCIHRFHASFSCSPFYGRMGNI